MHSLLWVLSEMDRSRPVNHRRKLGEAMDGWELAGQAFLLAIQINSLNPGVPGTGNVLLEAVSHMQSVLQFKIMLRQRLEENTGIGIKPISFNRVFALLAGMVVIPFKI